MNTICITERQWKYTLETRQLHTGMISGSKRLKQDEDGRCMSNVDLLTEPSRKGQQAGDNKDDLTLTEKTNSYLFWATGRLTG